MNIDTITNEISSIFKLSVNVQELMGGLDMLRIQICIVVMTFLFGMVAMIEGSDYLVSTINPRLIVGIVAVVSGLLAILISLVVLMTYIA